MLRRMFQTDKIGHGYLPKYLAITAELSAPEFGRRPVVLELGVRDGSSLHMWQTLMPYAFIIGVDHDPACAQACPDGTVFVHCDQADPDLPDRIDAILEDQGLFGAGIDLLVDDASHLGELTMRSFQNLWGMVERGGMYVIEDWYVGFDKWPDYDRSMLTFIEHQLGTFDATPDAGGIDSLELRYGMATFRKR